MPRLESILPLWILDKISNKWKGRRSLFRWPGCQRLFRENFGEFYRVIREGTQGEGEKRRGSVIDGFQRRETKKTNFTREKSVSFELKKRK